MNNREVYEEDRKHIVHLPEVVLRMHHDPYSWHPAIPETFKALIETAVSASKWKAERILHEKQSLR